LVVFQLAAAPCYPFLESLLETAMSSNVFYTSLNDFCRKYFVIDQKPLTLAEQLQFPINDATERAKFFEHLLLFDTISIKVYGENIPLVVLLRLFGEKGLENLFEQGAIRFVLWTPMITHNVTEIPGVNALQSGRINSPAHSDPEQSVDFGLNWLQRKLSDKQRRHLKKKVLPLYEAPPEDIAIER
jgi:hypothetical protein